MLESTMKHIRCKDYDEDNRPNASEERNRKSQMKSCGLFKTVRSMIDF